MTRSSLLVGALAATVFAASDLSAMPNDSAPVPEPAAGTVMLLAQGGSGGGGDSAGRGSDTSKGAVPQDKNYPTGQYPSGIESRGTMPAPGSPGTPPASTGSTTSPGTDTGGGAPGTGLSSPGTTQKGGTTRTDK